MHNVRIFVDLRFLVVSKLGLNHVDYALFDFVVMDIDLFGSLVEENIITKVIHVVSILVNLLQEVFSTPDVQIFVMEHEAHQSFVEVDLLFDRAASDMEGDYLSSVDFGEGILE